MNSSTITKAKKVLNNDNYYSDKKYLSNSMLSMFKRSPLHLQYSLDKQYVLESPALEFGSMYDTLVFEVEEFDSIYSVMPEGMRRGTNAYKEWANNNAFSKAVSFNEWKKAINMKDALMEHSEIWEMISIGESQKILSWEFDGVPCKGKVDNYIEGHAIIDLKTTKDVSYDGFIRAISYNYHYDRQAAWYIDGDGNNLEFWWVAQEKEAPYIPALYKASNETLQRGREKYTELFYEYKNMFIDNKFDKDKYFINREI